jgi:hypothetical protein
VLKVSTFSPLQVKNKPLDREMEHAFILGSIMWLQTIKTTPARNTLFLSAGFNYQLMTCFYSKFPSLIKQL